MKEIRVQSLGPMAPGIFLWEVLVKKGTILFVTEGRGELHDQSLNLTTDESPGLDETNTQKKEGLS